MNILLFIFEEAADHLVQHPQDFQLPPPTSHSCQESCLHTTNHNIPALCLSGSEVDRKNVLCDGGTTQGIFFKNGLLKVVRIVGRICFLAVVFSSRHTGHIFPTLYPTVVHLRLEGYALGRAITLSSILLSLSSSERAGMLPSHHITAPRQTPAKYPPNTHTSPGNSIISFPYQNTQE